MAEILSLPEWGGVPPGESSSSSSDTDDAAATTTLVVSPKAYFPLDLLLTSAVCARRAPNAFLAAPLERGGEKALAYQDAAYADADPAETMDEAVARCTPCLGKVLYALVMPPADAVLHEDIECILAAVPHPASSGTVTYIGRVPVYHLPPAHPAAEEVEYALRAWLTATRTQRAYVTRLWLVDLNGQPLFEPHAAGDAFCNTIVAQFDRVITGDEEDAPNQLRTADALHALWTCGIYHVLFFQNMFGPDTEDDLVIVRIPQALPLFSQPGPRAIFATHQTYTPCETAIVAESLLTVTVYLVRPEY